ncbi:MAG TPA: hypothetical protein VGD36_14750 [Xanthobacteraceae bacterium]|jgi:hypothetical protein
MGLMAEMRTSFQKLAHREVGKRHDNSGYAAADEWDLSGDFHRQGPPEGF